MAAENPAAEVELALRDAVETMRIALDQIASSEVEIEVATAQQMDRDKELSSLSTNGLLILVECRDGQHWIFACPASSQFAFSSRLSAKQLQPIVDSIREALCSTLKIKATHVLFAKDIGKTLNQANLDDTVNVVSIRTSAKITDHDSIRVMGPAPDGLNLLPTRKPVTIAGYTSLAEGLSRLPPYARSLLKVSVPISVTLASTRRPVSSIVKLGPGAIIQFKKSCDETLTLEVAGLSIAEGEAVKIGEKLGLYVTDIIMPGERFRRVQDL
jgi:flagellar motor switch/type III secretory pathway protein FliN